MHRAGKGTVGNGSTGTAWSSLRCRLHQPRHRGQPAPGMRITFGRWLKAWLLHINQLTVPEVDGLSWTPVGCLGGREPLLTQAEVPTAEMLIQSARTQAARWQAKGVQHSSSPTRCCRQQGTLRSKRKPPFPQQKQRIIHLSRNGTSICKRSTSIRFALNPTNICESTN